MLEQQECYSPTHVRKNLKRIMDIGKDVHFPGKRKWKIDIPHLKESLSHIG